VTRIAVGAGLGGVIGFERDLHGRHVGLRTHLIVAMASATYMVISAHFMFYQGYTEHMDIDASRIASSVVTGIGFLAGGSILKTGLTIQGLTTGLWLVTAIGMAAGAGMYTESAAVTVMGIFALTLLRRFEDKNDLLVRRRVSIVIDEGQNRIDHLMGVMTGMGAKVSDFDYERKIDERTMQVTFDVRFPVTVGAGRLIEELEKQNGLHELQVRVPE
jgi:putative Mg2+ transporter-C (MgtC) family protein